ncbi:MAG TPA: PQQ-binding-like beta-propeller repeat protein [Planctomycetota bacterium]|nr:PQQ-binding-like beta-propeller repeat protein [Planctomycetota bacterium]
MKTGLLILAVGALIPIGSAFADDWPAFRGPAGDGISTEKSAPTSWGKDKNIKWRVALGMPGNGSPIVSNGRVFIAGSEDREGKKRFLSCFDRKDGKELWTKTVEFGKAMPTHDTNPHSSSTPAADGRVVVVWHSSAGLCCYDFEGKELWKRDLGEFEHMWGDGTSPVIYKDLVLLNSGPGKKKVFVAAFKLASGQTVWEKDEPFKGDGEYNEDKKYMGSWTTPLIVRFQGKDQIICSMPTRLVAYAPTDGALLWSCEGLRFDKGDLSYSSPIVAGDLCVIVGGFNGPSMGVRLGGSGDVTAMNRVWRLDKSPQSIGSGVFVDGNIYIPYTGANVIDCMDPKTGKSIWRQRATGAETWGSMSYAAGRIYVTDKRGRTVVIKPNPEKLEIIATNELGEASNCTPAISDGQIFIRTDKGLYCIAE